jgi:hypothetical protein
MYEETKEESVLSKPPGSKNPLMKVIVALALTESIVLVATAGFCLVRGRATGIATGYEEAAARAYQMGRPLPDTIFETGMFRVAVTSQSSTTQTPFRVRIAVKDRIFNSVLFQHVRPVEILR